MGGNPEYLSLLTLNLSLSVYKTLRVLPDSVLGSSPSEVPEGVFSRLSDPYNRNEHRSRPGSEE